MKAVKKGDVDDINTDITNVKIKPIPMELKDPRYIGMQKMSVNVKSTLGVSTEVHYVHDPRTGKNMDFKFKGKCL